jgi:hypothetical protein
MNDLHLTFKVNQPLLQAARTAGRSSRVATQDGTDMGLGLRVDRWALLIVNAVILGCHHFDQIAYVLGIASSVLSRRLSGMVEAGLLLCQPDLNDARRNIYRLTPASAFPPGPRGTTCASPARSAPSTRDAANPSCPRSPAAPAATP